MNDYISRESVLQILSDKNAAWDAYQKVQSIPAADVVPVGAYNQAAWERDTVIEQLNQIGKSFGEQMNDVRPVRHGRWIEREDMYYGWNIWECSVCHEEFCVEEGTPKDNEYNYCPNCGADMREES